MYDNYLFTHVHNICLFQKYFACGAFEIIILLSLGVKAPSHTPKRIYVYIPWDTLLLPYMVDTRVLYSYCTPLGRWEGLQYCTKNVPEYVLEYPYILHTYDRYIPGVRLNPYPSFVRSFLIVPVRRHKWEWR